CPRYKPRCGKSSVKATTSNNWMVWVMLISVVSKDIAARQPGEILASANNPAASNPCHPGQTVHCKFHDIALAIVILVRGGGFFRAGSCQERIAQLFRMRRGDSESRCKHTGLVAAAEMVGVETVIPKLGDVYDGKIGLREIHVVRTPILPPRGLARFIRR